LGGGSGHFADPSGAGVPFPSPAVDAAAGDLNGDGFPDVVVVSGGASHSVTVRFGAAGGGLGNPTTIALPNGATPIAVVRAALHCCGFLDVVVAAVDGNVYILRNDGTGVLGAPVPFVAVANPVRPVVGDVNGDAIPDILVASSATGQVAR